MDQCIRISPEKTDAQVSKILEKPCKFIDLGMNKNIKEAFAKIQGVQALNLQGTNVTDQDLATICNKNTKIYYLNMSQCQRVSQKALYNLKNIRVLDISYTDITTLQPLVETCKTSLINLKFLGCKKLMQPELALSLLKIQKLKITLYKNIDIKKILTNKTLEVLTVHVPYQASIKKIEAQIIGGTQNLCYFNIYCAEKN